MARIANLDGKLCDLDGKLCDSEVNCVSWSWSGPPKLARTAKLDSYIGQAELVWRFGLLAAAWRRFYEVRDAAELRSRQGPKLCIHRSKDLIFYIHTHTLYVHYIYTMYTTEYTLFIYIYIYVCMYVYMYVCIYVYIYILYTYICIFDICFVDLCVAPT